MKKILISFALCAATLTASAVNWSSTSFFLGRNVFITNSSPTITFGDTNVLYQTLAGQVVYSLTNNIGGSNNWGAAFAPRCVIYPSAIGMVSDDWSILAMVGNTNLIVTTNTQGAITPIPNTGNYFPPNNAANTNVVTFTFAPLPDGTNAVTTGTWAFSVTPNGLTPVVVKTNIPTAVALGARAWRLQTISISTNTTGGAAGNGTGILINDLRINGPNP